MVRVHSEELVAMEDLWLGLSAGMDTRREETPAMRKETGEEKG